MKNHFRLLSVLLAFSSVLRGYYDVTVTGSTTGAVWGTDVYAANSHVATTAVHAGVLASGQTAPVRVYLFTRQISGFIASTRNGVTTMNAAMGDGMVVGPVPSGSSNSPLVVLNLPSTVFTGQGFWITTNAMDPDGDLNNTVLFLEGTGVVDSQLDSGDSRTMETMLVAPQAAGPIRLRAQVTDNAGHVTTGPWQTVQVVAPGTNISPTAWLTGPNTVVAGAQNTWVCETSDPNANLSFWRLSVAPNTEPPTYISGGSATTSSSRTFATAGTYTLSLYVEDTTGASGTASLVVTVVAPPANYIDYPNGVSCYPPSKVAQSPVTNYSYLVDGSHTNHYGYGSGNGDPNWLKADFGSPKQVLRLYVGGGHLHAWGTPAGSSSGATLAYSNDNVNWTLAHTFTNGFSVDGTSIDVNITARYWRLARHTWFGTTEYRFEGVQTPYTLTVQNGEGGGTGIYAGSPRPILGNAPPSPNHLFKNWTVVSGPGTISDSNSASTNFIMGAGDATIRADYELNQAPTALITGPATRLVGQEGTWTYSAADANKNLSQWRVSLLPNSAQWTSISGSSQATQFNYTFLAPGEYTFRLEVKDSFGLITTKDALVRVDGPPVITSQPQDQMAAVGGSVTFSVVATGNPALTYQWQHKPFGGAGFVNLASGGAYNGFSTASLSVRNIVAAMRGDQFRCVITNVAGAVTSNVATLIFSSADVDTDGDGVTNTLEIALGLNPSNAGDVSVKTFEYDKINQLKRGPGGEYSKDAEGNIKGIQP